MIDKFKLPEGVTKFFKGKKIHGGQWFSPSDFNVSEEELRTWSNAAFKESLIVSKPIEKEKVDFDFNDDGKFDKKDLSLAGEALQKSKKKSKRKPRKRKVIKNDS